MMKSYMGLVPRYFKKQFKKYFLTVLGIVLSVSLIVSIGSISESVKQALIASAKKVTGDYHAYYKNL